MNLKVRSGWITKKATKTNIRAAKNIAMDKKLMKTDEKTQRQVAELVGKEAPEEEKAKLKEVMGKVASKGTKLRKEVRRKKIGAKLRDVNTGAAPGPSGTTNSFIKALEKSRGGIAALRKWCNM